MEIKVPKKLIEVALPLDAINAAAAREKSIRHGHPSTLHLWWARRPLAAARAVLFAQLVNDPGYERHLGRGVNKQKAEEERKRLFGIIERMILWENTNNEAVLAEAREEVRKSWRETCHLNRSHPQAASLFDPENLPAFHDPFAGGGAIPLEAQRLGLEAWASDLNPVAVLINKAMVEIPTRFAGRPPVSPLPGDAEDGLFGEDKAWSGSQGLAEDVRQYGKWVRDKAAQQLGHLYPKVEITEQMTAERPDLKPLMGQKLTVVAWLWTRTVKSPNPAFSHVDVPLASNFTLSTKAGKEAYIVPILDGDSYHFAVRVGKPPDPAAVKRGTKAGGSHSNFLCLMSNVPMPFDYLRSEAASHRLGARLMAIVAQGNRGRVYLAGTTELEEIAGSASPSWIPNIDICHWPGRTNVVEYGMTTFGDLFSPRQLTTLNTLSNLIAESRHIVRTEALRAGWEDDGLGLEAGGTGATAYADAVAVYLSMALSKLCDYGTTLCRWFPERDSARSTFGRHALPMSWDFTELNPIHDATGSFRNGVIWVAEVLSELCVGTNSQRVAARVFTADARTLASPSPRVFSTDPPYYDNIGYAGLSDFFYVWLRRTLRGALPSLFASISVPKDDELVANPYRYGGKRNAEEFFLQGMTAAMQRLAQQSHPAFPLTIYYAFKASETKNDGTSSTGWETFLEAVREAGLALTGTWPMRTEMSNRMIASGTNSLASSIVLVCRQRDPLAPTVSRREFVRELNATLPEALADMLGSGEHSPVAPVDLSQAVLGPGMAIFSKYSAVLEANGQAMTVRTALQLINRFLAEEDFDRDTQFCLHWFEQQRWETGKFGEADVLARAKGTSVDGVREAGILSAGRGEVRLLRIDELPQPWDPRNDARLPVWEALHHLVRTFRSGGEEAAGRLLARIAGRADAIRQLAYRLYTLCERKGWAEDARPYNELIAAWSHIETQMQHASPAAAEQGVFDYAEQES